MPVMAPSRPTLGIIAGQGRLPLLVAEGMKRSGCLVGVVGLRGQFQPGLAGHCDVFAAAVPLQPKRWIRLLEGFGAKQAVLVGRVDKSELHQPGLLLRHPPDRLALRLLLGRMRADRRNGAMLTVLADALADRGIELIDSTTHIQDHLAVPGVMGRVEPTARQMTDVEFGWPLVARLTGLDIGQAMTIRGRDVIAVEALEGTDRLIERTGELCPRGGWSLLKTAADDHDRRADVPTVGVETIERVAAAGGTCLALGANRVIMVERPKVIAAADEAGIALLGMWPADLEQADLERAGLDRADVDRDGDG